MRGMQTRACTLHRLARKAGQDALRALACAGWPCGPAFPSRNLKKFQMRQNLIDLARPAESLTAIDEALAELESHLCGLIALTVDQRRQLTKMGDKSEAFCRQAMNVMADNPSILPRNLDLTALQRDLTALDALRPRLLRLPRLHERASDTEMALGSNRTLQPLRRSSVDRRTVGKPRSPSTASAPAVLAAHPKA